MVVRERNAYVTILKLFSYWFVYLGRHGSSSRYLALNVPGTLVGLIPSNVEETLNACFLKSF